MTDPPQRKSHGRREAVRPVHLLGGLPTEGVRRGFDRIREVLPVRSFAGFLEPTIGEWAQMGVLLPPHIETSQVVEEWEVRDYLAHRFGRGAHIGNVLALVASDLVGDQLESADPISACGWGKGTHDLRTVADIAVGQIESATHLVLVGSSHSRDALLRVLSVLNPSAARLALDDASDAGLLEFVTRSRRAGNGGCPADSARIVPPWLDLLQAESAASCAPGRFLYRRSRPFDPERFGEWIANPPRELVRGKGKIWLANRCDAAFGYSCAGSVHRVFAAGGWWASCGGSTWPACDEERRRLLDRWHPHFGDRRQEIAFVGVDLDTEEVSSALDSCLLSEQDALHAVLPASLRPRSSAVATPRDGLH